MRSFWPFAMLVTAGVAAAGCQTGRGRVVSPADVAAQPGWVRVDGVPFVRQRAERDCGAAALAMVLGYWGVAVDEGALAAALPAPGARGLRAGELRELARARGLDAFLIKGEPADLRAEIERRRPLIVGLARPDGRAVIGHYEVVIGFDHTRHRILTLDPAAGFRDSSVEEFATEWAGAQQLALVVFRRAP